MWQLGIIKSEPWTYELWRGVLGEFMGTCLFLYVSDLRSFHPSTFCDTAQRTSDTQSTVLCYLLLVSR